MTLWWHRFGSTLAQIMDCCLMAPSHHLKHYCLIIKDVLWHSPGAISPEMLKISFHKISLNITFSNHCHISHGCWMSYVFNAFKKLCMMMIAWCNMQANEQWKSRVAMMSAFLWLAAPQIVIMTLQWHHNEHDGISNHQPHDCLLNHLFRRRSKKTSKLHVIDLWEGNSPVTGEFPAQRPSNAVIFLIWWRHHGLSVMPPVKTKFSSS